jgi:hypothetical protein
MEEPMNVSQEKITVKELVGINPEGIIWGRLASFFFALLLSSLFITLLETLIRHF